MRVIEVTDLNYVITIEGLVGGVLTEAFPRKCDYCGCGMSEGYVVGDVGYLCQFEGCDKALSIALEQAGYKDRDEAYEDGFYYYTDWNGDSIQEGDIVYTEEGEELLIKLKN